MTVPRWAWLAAGALLVLAAAGWLALRSERVTFALLDRTAAHILTRDALAELPDGIHVLLCGAGSPVTDINRSGPCVAVQAGAHLYVIDAGTNGGRNISRFGVGVGRVEAVLLTHAHSDHIDGLGELGMLNWTNGNRAAPLPVYGPPVVSDVVAGFNLAYAADARYRIAHHPDSVVPAAGAGLRAEPFPLPADGELRTVIQTTDGVRISAFRVSHEPVSEAVGYRIDYGERAVVVSGDTAKSDNLIRHARGVDLLVHEALGTRITARIAAAADAAGASGPAQLMRDIVTYHATPVEAAESAAEAGAGRLLIHHIAPQLPLAALERVFLAGVADAYDGPVTLGTDGTLISLPLEP